AWPVACLYGLWAWRALPAMRTQLAIGAAAIPAMWFGIPALVSDSWFVSGQIALDSTRALPGNRLSSMVSGFAGLYEVPMQLAALFALLLAVARRDRTWLLIAGAALLWLTTEAAFALHGWNPSARYMFAPAAVLIVLAGAALGRILAITSGHPLLRWATVAAILGLVVTLAPDARIRGRLAHNGIVIGRAWARQLDRLHVVIHGDGGAGRILRCGQPVTQVGFQSVVAWEIGENVADVGWDPSTSVADGKPVVLIEAAEVGWEVRPVHTDRADCDRLSTRTVLSWDTPPPRLPQRS
ncbi:MAG: hypothetical protein M3018_13830, partial [Actinomycetota bacterium]|nr:hypothetical protein [Actinomycetota bacterium]